MGRVYSPGEIEAGFIPDKGTHQNAARYVLEQLAELEKRDPILAREVSCVVYGSTATGMSDIRSDVDVCASVYTKDRYSNKKSRAQIVFEEIIRSAERKYHVVIEERIVSEEVFFQGGTYNEDQLPYVLDPLYVRHLIDIIDRFPEWCHGRPPIDGYRESPYDPFGEEKAAIAWTTLKFGRVKVAHMEAAIDRLEKADQRVLYKDLQRALELPKALGRKAVVVCSADAALDVTNKAAMHALVNEVAQSYGGERLVTGQRALQEIDANYTAVLRDTLLGGTSLKGYQAWLRQNNLPALEIAKEVAGQWTDILKTNAQKVTEQTGILEEEVLGVEYAYEKD